MRVTCILSAGLLILCMGLATACTNACLVSNPCGTRCVAAPVVCRLPCGTVLQGGAASDPASDALLQTKVAKVDWDELMISEVLADLRAKTGVEVFTDQAVWSKHYDQARVTLHAEDVTVDQVLGVVFAPFDFTWKGEGGRIVVRPGDATP